MKNLLIFFSLSLAYTCFSQTGTTNIQESTEAVPIETDEKAPTEENRLIPNYAFTSSAFAVKKRTLQAKLGLLGAELQYGLGKNFSVGLMTSWILDPVVGTIKKSWKIGKKSHFAVGGLIGGGTFIFRGSAGALPYGTFTFGDESKNISISGGYGIFSEDAAPESRTVTSIAGSINLSPKFSLIFDSFIILPGRKEQYTTTYNDIIYNQSTGQYEHQQLTSNYTYQRSGSGLVMSGIRMRAKKGIVLQFGLAGVKSALFDEAQPKILPVFQLYRTFF